ncbi:hypothetical protein PCCS19_16640 [Paenibacillus sp. CCS19]|uniref:response regulator n=1 Tax=Paenibacillus sp. CCS19 TaxID=3158387 RepID=UPI0025601405|nr:response regulator [Paenibacillus cellulosilyticus]GMK38610.1 hypothetical protein PCCS19_16640 [Paenibacillus cellulosilyticus]
MNVIIIDDERIALNYLERQLSTFPNVSIVGAFMNPLLAIDAVKSQRPDAVFLDIDLPEMNGMELAERLLEISPSLQVIFVTAYNQFAVHAFEISAVDYIMKPYEAGRLQKTIQRINERLNLHIVDETLVESILKVRVMRQLMLEPAGGSAKPLNWRTVKAMELFLYLLQHRGLLVRKSTIIDQLWPTHDTDKAYSLLYSAVYQIRKTLADYHEHFQIVNQSEGYMLTLHQVWLDADHWQKQLDDLAELDEGSIASHESVMTEYTGDYLQTYDYLWAEGERERLLGKWLLLAHRIGHWYRENGNHEKALTIYSEICHRYPTVEDAHYNVMKIYAALGKQTAVVQQYEQLCSIMTEELDVSPSGYIREWFDSYMHLS